MRFFFKVAPICLTVIFIASCGKRTPTEFEVAESAVGRHDLAALRVAVIANPSIVTQGSGFDGGTLLRQALVNQPSFECAEFLLTHGANPNQPDVTGEYPIHVICRYNGNIKCLNLLLDNGADPSINWKGGMTSVQLARQWNFEEAALILEAAIAKP
jgi:Ankyrin repeats (3 copies)